MARSYKCFDNRPDIRSQSQPRSKKAVGHQEESIYTLYEGSPSYGLGVREIVAIDCLQHEPHAVAERSAGKAATTALADADGPLKPPKHLLGVHSRYGLHTRAVTEFRDTLYRRLQPFRYLRDCSGCFRLKRLPGGTCTRWKSAAFHGVHPHRTLESVVKT